jgi:drug/metabolite transporter (DMT)-like permease
VEAAVAGAVLAAALLHASWHALVKTSGDRIVALAGMNIVSGAAALFLMPFVDVPAPAALWVIAGSVLLHFTYKISLATLYARADLSRAYPVARGITPPLALLLAFVFLGELPGVVTIAGVLAISVGIFALVGEGAAVAFQARTFLAAAVAGAMVAAYSLADAYGARLNHDWLGYSVWLIAWDAITFVAYALAMRRRTAVIIWRNAWRRTLVSGSLGVASFVVAMWALSRAPVAAVSALRETSILFAALIGATFLRERLTRGRFIGVLVVVSGTVAIAFDR